MINQKSSTIAIIDRHDRLLLLLRGETAPYNPNKYCLPGGKLEENESLIDCAIRELYEETSIEIYNHSQYLKPVDVVYKNGNSKVVFLYRSPYIHDVSINWEHSDYNWWYLSDALSLPLVPGLRTTIKRIGELTGLM
jgi:8-oxo-dGTP pyrophosphatase MutT (NUDIX family)